jgi:O-methyltransferase involved in polyketide biosynthesis
MVGIESRRRVAELARTALASDAEIVDADARIQPPGRPHVVFLFDVLHMMPAQDQESLLAAIAANLEPGGVILVREADASGGWRFAAVRAVNRVKALMLGSWRQPFHFRTRAEWLECFRRLGFDAAVRPAEGLVPFANVLFRLTAASRDELA